MGEHRHGGFAEYVAMPSRCFFPLPDDADLAAAGALMTGHLTAWRMLFGKRALRPGESVLIVGIGGGVAVACLQLAKLIGARVFVTSSSDAKIARAIELGAEGGVNYTTGRGVEGDPGDERRRRRHGDRQRRRGELGRIAEIAAPRRPARHLRRDDGRPIRPPICNASSSANSRSTARPAAASANSANCSTCSAAAW